MNYLQILILAVIQGAAELLPVSSSAHVIVAEKLIGIKDPSAPEMIMLLVMLHTGTMFAMIAYFWKSWQRDYFSVPLQRNDFIAQLVVATFWTNVVGIGLKVVIEKVFMHGAQKAEIETLFSNIPLVAGALFTVGILIILAGIRSDRSGDGAEIQLHHSCWIGFVQGLALPFRGFSRSGSTISTGLLLGVSRRKLEEFSFALAVILTPEIIALEAVRLLHSNSQGPHLPLLHLLAPSLVGMVFSFLAGLLALKWLSRWLECGQWKLFGFYCLAAATAVLTLHFTIHI